MNIIILENIILSELHELYHFLNVNVRFFMTDSVIKQFSVA